MASLLLLPQSHLPPPTPLPSPSQSPSLSSGRPPQILHRRVMTTNLATYSPLESFLLFQYLSSYGVDHASFDRVSRLLQSNPLINNAATFDTGRLSADALRDLYSRLLKEEIHSDLETTSAADSDARRPDGSFPSRKRKAPSPSLPSAQEASQAAHLIPQLITKLYTRYRQYAIREIRDQEQAYSRLQRELQEIRQGEWDERLRREIEQGQWKALLAKDGAANGVKPAENGHSPAPADATTTAQMSSDAHRSRFDPHISNQVQQRTLTPAGLPAGSQADLPATTTLQPSDPRDKTAQPSPIPPTIAPSPTAANTQRLGSATPGKLSPSVTPSLPPQPPRSPGAGPVSAQPPTAGGAPALVSQLPHPLPGAAASPRLHPGSAAASPGTKPDQGKPTPNLAPGTPSVPPTGARQPPDEQAQSPSQRGTPAPPTGWPQGYPPAAQKSPQTVPYVSTYQHNPQGGYMLPPFQVSLGSASQPQTPQPLPVTPLGPQAAAAAPPKRGLIPQPVNPATPIANRPIVPPQLSNTIIGWLRDTPPAKVIEATRTPPASSGVATPGAADGPIPKRPRHMSPISDRAPSPPPPTRRTKSTRSQPTPGQTQKDSFTEPEPRQTRRTTGRTRRRGSAASSVVDSSLRGRSQSVASHADDVSVDAESTAGRPIKPDPSTPAEAVEDIRSTIEHTPTTGVSTRRRRGTLASTQRPAPPKRKRSGSETTDNRRTATPVAVPLGSGVRSQFVLATRNFPRVSNPVMQTITSHKHASLFAHPVKPKDAEGYYDVIHRPTDLKSIRAAITAGARAVAAAAASQADSGTGGAPSPGAAGASGASVALPLGPEVVPPKAIVNSAQLERELLRMLANAVMFNPGEDGVVRDAREMFESVETEVSNWRAAERGGGDGGSG